MESTWGVLDRGGKGKGEGERDTGTGLRIETWRGTETGVELVETEKMEAETKTTRAGETEIAETPSSQRTARQQGGTD